MIVINSGVPWMPRSAKPKASAKVIHIGIDPLLGRYPFRDYEADLLVGRRSRCRRDDAEPGARLD